MATTVTPLPQLDRTAPDFRQQTNLFFGSQLPTFTVQINQVSFELMTARDETVAARNESVPLANQVITLAPQAIAASNNVSTLAPQVAQNAQIAETARANAVAAAAQATAVNMGGSTGYPAFPPSMLNDWANSRFLRPAFTRTRAAAATYVDQLGRLRTAASGEPVFEWDATGRCRGLRVEPARTNVLLNSATLATQSVAVTAQAYTLSFYGSGSVTLSGTATGTTTGTGAANRTTITFTPTAGSLTLTVAGSVTSGQLEAGASATSYIPTTTVAVTRPADVITLPAAAAVDVLNPLTGTIAVEFTLSSVPTGSNNSYVFSLNDNSDSNKLILRAESTGIRAYLLVGGALASSITLLGTIPVVDARYRVVIRWTAASMSASINGLAVVSSAISPALAVGISWLNVGHDRTAAQLNGHLASLLPYSRIPSDSSLIAMSTL